MMCSVRRRPLAVLSAPLLPRATEAFAAATPRRKELAADDDVEIAEAVSGVGSGGFVRVPLGRALKGAVRRAEVRRGNDLLRRRRRTENMKNKIKFKE